MSPLSLHFTSDCIKLKPLFPAWVFVVWGRVLLRVVQSCCPLDCIVLILTQLGSKLVMFYPSIGRSAEIIWSPNKTLLINPVVGWFRKQHAERVVVIDFWDNALTFRYYNMSCESAAVSISGDEVNYHISVDIGNNNPHRAQCIVLVKSHNNWCFYVGGNCPNILNNVNKNPIF